MKKTKNKLGTIILCFPIIFFVVMMIGFTLPLLQGSDNINASSLKLETFGVILGLPFGITGFVRNWNKGLAFLDVILGGALLFAWLIVMILL